MKRPRYYAMKADSAYALGFTLLAVALAFGIGFAGCCYSGTKWPAVACLAFSLASVFGAFIEFRIARRADARAASEHHYQSAEGQ